MVVLQAKLQQAQASAEQWQALLRELAPGRQGEALDVGALGEQFKQGAAVHPNPVDGVRASQRTCTVFAGPFLRSSVRDSGGPGAMSRDKS